jgi:2-polyprenyl-6-methoxyphenol hydroxylase-like FAD-dependent oxidoreductase
MLGQSDHEALLRSHIEKLGGKIELSTSIVSFQQSDDHVTVDLVKTTADGKETKETVKCQYLIGTDGAHSIVRKTAGMTFLGESRPSAKFIFGDIHVKKELTRDVSFVG